MTWDRFGYICRKAASDSSGASLAARLEQAQSEQACSLYGPAPKADSWPAQLLTRLAAMPEPDNAERALNTYQRLNLSRQLEAPVKFKRALAYLAYVTFVFYLVAGIYQFKITPTFSDLLNNLEMAPPAYLALYQTYWSLFILAISLLILLALLSALQMRRLFQFKVNAHDSLACRLLVLPSCRHAYRQMADALQYPTLDRHALSEQSPVLQHLQQVEERGMDLAIEIQALTEVQMQGFLQACEKQLKALTTLIAVVVIVAVMMFLTSAYAPIFSLGEAI